MMMMIELDIKVFHREREHTRNLFFYVFFSLKLILRIYFKNIDIYIYILSYIYETLYASYVRVHIISHTLWIHFLMW